VSTPTKFVIHGWRVLLNRIATKEHLYAKGIINSDCILCVFCLSDIESRNHVLFSCPFAYGVWTSIYRWLGFEGAFAEAAAVQHGGMFMGSRWNKTRHLVWIYVIWSLWIG
jgi:hypothetical protein